jgi:hypothetical protein
MSVIVYPLATRRACLKMFVNGDPLKDATRMHGPTSSLIHTWAKKAGVQRGDKTPDAELDKKIAAWGETIRTYQAQMEQRAANGGGVKKKKGNRVNEVYTNQRHGLPPSAVLKGPSNIQEYDAMIAECLEHVGANLARETTLEGKAKALMLGTLFMQMKSMLNSPLVAITVADQERIFNQTQKLLGMNDPKTQARRIDINILNAKVEQPKDGRKKPRVFEAEIVKPEPLGAPLPGPSILDLDSFEV